MSGKRVKKINAEEVFGKSKENKKYAESLEERKEEIPENYDGTVYCALDNTRCSGQCKEANTNKSGIVECSEFMTAKHLPRKRRNRRRRKEYLRSRE